MKTKDKAILTIGGGAVLGLGILYLYEKNKETTIVPPVVVPPTPPPVVVPPIIYAPNNVQLVSQAQFVQYNASQVSQYISDLETAYANNLDLTQIQTNLIPQIKDLETKVDYNVNLLASNKIEQTTKSNALTTALSKKNSEYLIYQNKEHVYQGYLYNVSLENAALTQMRSAPILPLFGLSPVQFIRSYITVDLEELKKIEIAQLSAYKPSPSDYWNTLDELMSVFLLADTSYSLGAISNWSETRLDQFQTIADNYKLSDYLPAQANYNKAVNEYSDKETDYNNWVNNNITPISQQITSDQNLLNSFKISLYVSIKVKNS